jgi:sugar lactone lactonase YvrE
MGAVARGQSLTVTHFAGTTGGGSYADGQGTAARFSRPSGIGIDSSGIVYVADSGNSIIRKISPAGLVSTLAGSPGHCGGIDGTGSGARFCFIQGVVPDENGNLFVADGQEIRKVTPDGTVTTFAGTPGLQGTADGTGAAARFYFPTAIVRDAAGNLYVTDSYSDFIPGGSVGFSTIRKITSDGVVTTIAGSPSQRGFHDGVGGSALFDFGGGGGLTLDTNGNLYVADTFNAVIRVVTPAGVVSTIVGSPGQLGNNDDNGSNARFIQPSGIILNSDGTLYVADAGGYTIRKVSPNLDVHTLAGGPSSPGFTDGIGSAARFSQLYRLASDGSSLYVVDAGNNAIRRVNIATAEVSTLAGGSPVEFGTTNGIGTAARFFGTWGAGADGSNLYVSDSFNDTIRKVVVATAQVTTFAGVVQQPGSNDGVAGTARLNYPSGLATDSTNLYVADALNSTIRTIGLASGTTTTLAGAAGRRGFADGAPGTAQFNFSVIDVSGLATDGTNLYAADTRNFVIRRIDLATGQVSTLAGSPGVSGSTDGVGANALFSSPAGVVADGGNLYVADPMNFDIRKVVISTGEVTTFAGAASQNGTADGDRTVARFAHPEGLAIDGTDLYVADDYGPTIRKIDLVTGNVTTVAGSPGYNGAMDGTGSAASMSNPVALAFTENRLFIVDPSLSTVRQGVCGADHPVDPVASPQGNPNGPVTGVDYLDLTWATPHVGPANGYDWAINGDPFTSTSELSATAPPRGDNDPITLHVRARACNPEVAGGATDSPTYSPAPPVASFTIAGAGRTFTFTDTSTPQATSWLWLFGDGQFATTQSVTHTYPSDGTFSVVLIATNGAGSNSSGQQQKAQGGSVNAGTLATKTFDTTDPQRQTLPSVRLAGAQLHVVPEADARGETIVYLRMLDDGGHLAKERRLSVAPGQEAVYDLGAYGVSGSWNLELASTKGFGAFIEGGARAPVTVDRAPR